MKPKIITVEIDSEGNSSIDLNGFQGKGCQKAVDAFAMGDKLKSSRNKPEYAIEPPVKVQQKASH